MDLSRLPRSRILEEHVFRFTKPKFSSPDQAISGIGGFQASSRYGVEGQHRLFYASFDEVTALHEAFRKGRFSNLPKRCLLPLVLLSLKVTNLEVIDLTLSEVQRVTGISEDTLVADWNLTEKSPTQEIGIAAFEQGVMGLIVPSAAQPGSKNLVIFPELLESPNQVICTSVVSWT